MTAGVRNLNVDSPLNLRILDSSTHHQADCCGRVLSQQTATKKNRNSARSSRDCLLKHPSQQQPEALASGFQGPFGRL